MFTVSQIYISAWTMRLFLLLYGEWQDLNMEVKFTDVDYYVFTDAAEFVSHGVSPYHRATYRYSPVLAWILTPNLYVHQTWGKLLFIISDFVTAYFIQCLLKYKSANETHVKTALCIWLLNPVTATVSCRGNAESVVSALVLSILYCLYMKKITSAGIMFAFAVHMKIYPAVYTVALFLFLVHAYSPNCKQSVNETFHHFWTRGILFVKQMLNIELLKFGAAAGCTFLCLTVFMYMLYGWDFLEHTYLYHLSRRDIRHNFSVYFYMLYTNSTPWLGIVCFVNQLAVIMTLSYLFSGDLSFCFFLLTYVFVTYNKICTSQYFLWYLSILPCLTTGYSHLKWSQWFIPLSAWFLGQALWLHSAYDLEFMGINTFIPIWLCGLLFFIFNTAILCWCVKSYTYHPIGYVVSESCKCD